MTKVVSPDITHPEQTGSTQNSFAALRRELKSGRDWYRRSVLDSKPICW